MIPWFLNNINKCRVRCQTTSSSWLMTRFGSSRCYCRTSWGDCLVLLFVNYCGKREGGWGPHAAEERVEWTEEEKKGGRYYIGAPPIKLYNNNILPCGVAIFTLAIYTGAAVVLVPFFFRLECRRLRRFLPFRQVFFCFFTAVACCPLPLFFIQSKDKKTKIVDPRTHREIRDNSLNYSLSIDLREKWSKKMLPWVWFSWTATREGNGPMAGEQSRDNRKSESGSIHCLLGPCVGYRSSLEQQSSDRRK
jgi:hypothetical protein